MTEPRTYNGNGHTATIADPENITRDECLALARCGAVAWNTWRNECPVRKISFDRFQNIADFSKVDFQSAPIDFYEMNLGDRANFSGAIFGANSNFVEHIFGREVDFHGAKFVYAALFDRAVFEHSVNFSGTVFGEGGADFVGAQFGPWANFHGSIFQGRANFQGAIFGNFAFFSGTVFYGIADFAVAKFGLYAGFIGESWDELMHRFRQEYSGSHDVLSKHFRPDVLYYCNFDGCEFEGAVNFSRREFLGSGSFSAISQDIRVSRLSVREEDGRMVVVPGGSVEETVFPKGLPVRFGEPPIFHGCKLHPDFSFEGAIFPTPSGSNIAARAYRTLKLAFSQQQATREEQRFFKLEMQEEAAAESGWKRWLYRAYEGTSDFGFSVWQPLVTLVLLPALVAMLLYLLCMCIQHPELWTSGLAQDSKLTSEWLQFTFANMAPLPDGELLKDLRTNLFGSNTYAAFIALKLETLQKVLALAGYFLFGLALRNLFKMK